MKQESDTESYEAFFNDSIPLNPLHKPAVEAGKSAELRSAKGEPAIVTPNPTRFLTAEASHASGNLIFTMQGKSDMFKFLRRQDGATYVIGGVTCWRPRFEQLEGVKGNFVLSETAFEHNNVPNLMLLMAQDLDRGVTFRFPDVPVSEQRVKRWLGEFEIQIRMLYLAYIKPTTHRAEFTTQTIVREHHD